ncbi:uncharacterized protein LTR77_008970 [Saxophila tyrrhenica]|uniref:Uncharacterized protein n=1 Tax=Saxophila tyrrhenica TaxID=1690608 RepID=A0AAV9P2J9_9PEZI|nr:hypothetical protein LTR77_008970 [Saxophila tyrrhenica]
MEDSTSINQAAHTFTARRTEMYRSTDTCAPTPLLQQLSLRLLALPQLSKLELAIIKTKRQQDTFSSLFHHHSLTLPNILTLTLGPGLQWLIPHCPNVRTITSDPYSRHSSLPGAPSGSNWHLDLVHAAGSAKHLHHLEVDDRMSAPLLLRHITTSVPHIGSVGTFSGRWENGIDRLFPLLKQLRELRTLALADVADLHVGYEPPRCGNVFLGPGGDEYRQQLEEEKGRAVRYVGRKVFERLEGLEECWVGNWDRAVVRRGKEGSVMDVAWERGWRFGVVHKSRFGG